MNKERHFVWTQECIIGKEKIIAIYITSMGYFKITDGSYGNSLEHSLCEHEDGIYRTLKIKPDEYFDIHKTMINLKIEYQSLEDSIDRMVMHARGPDSCDYRILDSLIFGELVGQNEREVVFMKRLFEEMRK